MSERNDVPLCVDLDETLVKTDVWFESLFSLLRRRLSTLLLLPFWLSKGIASLKGQIAIRAELDASALPYHDGLLDYLREQHESGRRLVLVTASDSRLARPIADHLGLFDDVLASDAQNDLSGPGKLERLQADYSNPGFDYAGGAAADLEVWRQARKAILVNAGPGVKGAAQQIERVFEDRRDTPGAYLRTLRPHQWLKNTLLFLPLLGAHQLGDPQRVLQALLAFVAFSLCASSVYVLNDLLDLEADRHHPRKRLRPLAAGTLSLGRATLLVPALLLGAIGFCVFLPAPFLLALGAYYLLTLGYSLRFKQIMLLDVIVLSALYTLRIIAGGAAVSVPVSFWLLALSMFLFFSLAMIKRYSELRALEDLSLEGARGRGYRVVDLESLISLGASSGYTAVLVLALYVNSEEVKRLYTRPELIWLLCPLLLYWIGRAWLLARRGEIHDDPVIFAIEDPVSRWLGAVGFVILLLAA